MKGKVELETLYFESSDDGVVLLTLNRPKFSNGVVPEMARDLTAALERLESDRQVRVLVLTGAGKNFCAGADLHAFKRHLEERLEADQEPFNARVLFPVTQRIVNCRLPVIAAINGAATAGGLDMALACDIRIAADNCRLGETYIKVGLSPGNGGTYFLPRLVGSGIAAELALTGDLADAEAALRMGLVNRVVPAASLVTEARSVAKKIASHSRLALEATKRQLRQSWHMDLDAAMNLGFWCVSALTRTPDLKEGVNAAIEGRPPVFNRGDQEPGND